MDYPSAHKALLKPLFTAMRDFAAGPVRSAMAKVFAADTQIHLCHPLGDLTGADALYDQAYAPLLAAMPDLERRDWIVMAGETPQGDHWLGMGGHYVGTFRAPWLDIPPTGHIAHMRYHEFYRISDGKIVEMQAIWDIPELMMQAGAWPMAPSLGREFFVPGPATQDGFVPGPWDRDQATVSCDHIMDMLAHLTRHPAQGGPEVMEMERFWHPRFNWYGPAGIGTARGVSGFRNWHQIPFLNAMPDRGAKDETLDFHFFGDGDYAAVTGWPNMRQSLSADGWLGLAPSGKMIDLRSLDFWRLESGLIRENWVLVDLLDVYSQLGVDVMARLREFNKARNLGPIPTPGDHQ
ncbi:ester cyclase [Phaeobacter gallaeciensis]|uniref:Ester cyclase n=1 Tax=Phaeobacter gallaeciensis TaxID=60890 RepID=A0AAD0EAC3_9RHOB|nr:putative ester cyclase [Phaeobacter gallaeciensis DSM 26640]ATE91739.1 putative ester cyclase [Phaeobacter gallaeciensis]ATE98437.1 putative ester cyclase [Phaeobacter gallaeciensis]ATF00355.1 putative ester cyclase [Phaeobacter gallaeciensis]ATF04787.1 putative ester cyclase [Phaeobacter gallaeciensis]